MGRGEGKRVPLVGREEVRLGMNIRNGRDRQGWRDVEDGRGTKRRFIGRAESRVVPLGRERAEGREEKESEERGAARSWQSDGDERDGGRKGEVCKGMSGEREGGSKKRRQKGQRELACFGLRHLILGA